MFRNSASAVAEYAGVGAGTQTGELETAAPEAACSSHHRLSYEVGSLVLSNDVGSEEVRSQTIAQREINDAAISKGYGRFRASACQRRQS